jgi:hypothetical protein
MTRRKTEDEVPNRVVWTAVAGLDRRALAAAQYAQLIPARSHAAIHVALDRSAARALGLSWMRSPLHGLPLIVVDDAGGIACTVRSYVMHELADGTQEVVVLTGRLAIDRTRRRLLHDSTADAIGRTLAGAGGSGRSRPRPAQVTSGVRPG